MLKRIEVKNFKSLKHIDFKCAGLNLLMGLNGAGKSSFVQLLEVLRVVATHGLKSSDRIAISEIGGKGKFSDWKYAYSPDGVDIDIEMEFGWREVVHAGKKSGEFILSDNSFQHLGIDGETPALDESYTVSRSIRDGGYGAVRVFHPALRDRVLCSKECNEYHAFVRDHGGKEHLDRAEEDNDVLLRYHELQTKFYDLKKGIFEDIEREDVKARDEFMGLWRHAQRIDAFRGKPECVHEGGRIDSRTCEDGNLRFDSEGENVVEFLDKFGKKIVLFKDNPMRRRGDEIEESSLLDEVNRWMSVVSPGVSIDIERVQCGDDEMLVENVCFGEGDEKRSFKPQNVGFGISYTLPVVVALLTAQPEDIIIIENPEAHLHPKGQAQMGELIARAAKWGVQLFIETHSDHVVNGIRSAVKDGIVKPSDVNIAFFERKEHDVPNEDGTSHQEIYSEVRNIRVDKNGSLSEYPDGFMDEWNNQLMELL